MKKIKKWIKIHWFSVMTILVVFILSFLAIYYAIDFSERTKNITEKRSIFQLAITAIAASVGIGTIVNSTRSASISAESMRVTKAKDIREQSSHPIVLSLIEIFPYNMPLYTKKVDYHFPTKISLELLEIDDDDFIGKMQFEADKPSFERTFNKEVKELISNLDSVKYQISTIPNEMEIKNVGKGSCVNLNYEFIFKNIREFDGYNVNLAKINNKLKIDVPSYRIIVKKDTDSFHMTITDNHLINFMNDIDIDYLNIEKNIINQSMNSSIVFSEKNIFRNHNFLESNGTWNVPIPNEFVILSKHYAIMKILSNQLKNKELDYTITPFTSTFLEGNLIKPIGVINLTFYDESLIRTGEYSSGKKTRLTYNVMLNEDATILKGNEFIMYLEANLIKPETSSKLHVNESFLI